MNELMNYEDALEELRACADLLERYKPRFAFPRDSKPVLAELHFGLETGKVTARLIDLDNGIWAYSLAKPNKHGIMLAIVSYWVSTLNIDASHLLFCPGCGAQSANQHRHAEGYRSVRVERQNISSNFRNRLQKLLQSGI